MQSRCGPSHPEVRSNKKGFRCGSLEGVASWAYHLRIGLLVKIREMAKDSAIYGASNAVNAAIGALGFLLLTRAIAPAEYGTLALVVSLSGIFITLGTLSISNGMSYYFFAAEK